MNVEFKARTTRLREQERLLLALGPRFVGEDHQVDTYFRVAHGRLKLREGLIENALIHYQRADLAGARASEVLLFQHAANETLKQMLTAALGVQAVVDKCRRIYFIDNVKFHFDEVAGLGTFVEVEALDGEGTLDAAWLQRQCAHYAELLGVRPQDYVAESYCDLVLKG